jgi:cytochrome bd-type quinol oxidase subunit 2
VKREIADLLMPWAGLMIGLVALAIAHQYGSDRVFDDCLATSPAPLLIVSVVAIAATIGGAFLSWRVFDSDAEAPARKVAAAVSMGTAALFVLAMLLPMIAALLIPPCFQ